MELERHITPIRADLAVIKPGSPGPSSPRLTQLLGVLEIAMLDGIDVHKLAGAEDDIPETKRPERP